MNNLISNVFVNRKDGAEVIEANFYEGNLCREKSVDRLEMLNSFSKEFKTQGQQHSPVEVKFCNWPFGQFPILHCSITEKFGTAFFGAILRSLLCFGTGGADKMNF